MSNNGIVNIHGKEYVTVAKRVLMAHEANDKTLSITTELVQNDPVLVKATVITPKGTFTGYSASYGAVNKQIEKQSPYEVAETSAIGRALGFAGYGVVEGIATADEMTKAATEAPKDHTREPVESDEVRICSKHDGPVAMVKGISKSTGREYWYHKSAEGKMCFGTGFKD